MTRAPTTAEIEAAVGEAGRALNARAPTDLAYLCATLRTLTGGTS